MKKQVFVLLSIVLSLACFSAPKVENVIAKQRFPWNGLVDIKCKVTGIERSRPYKFYIEAVQKDEGITNKVAQFWAQRNGIKQTNFKVKENDDYHLIWDAKADLGSIRCENMIVCVGLEDGRDKVQLWEGGPYWATTNIGAENPEDYGYYFWWGDTVGYKRENNKWIASDGSNSDFSFSSGNTPTYNKSISTLKNEGWITSDGVLAPVHDAAHIHWGNGWRMPTKQEIDDLINMCNWTWVRMSGSGVRGYIVSGKGDYSSASIFLPSAGYCFGTLLDGADECANYWASVPCSSLDSWTVSFDRTFCRTRGILRHCGLAVRPLQEFAK